MTSDRKEKIKTLQQILSGSKPVKKREPQVHILSDMTTDQLDALLRLKDDIEVW